MLFVSTGRVYDHARPIPFDEDTARTLYWGDYAKNKIAGEDVLLERHRDAGAAGDHRAAHPRLRAAQHAQQRDVLLRPPRARPSHPGARRGRLAAAVRPRGRPGRRHGRHARRAGRVRARLQRQRRGSDHPGRLRRADRRGHEAPTHADLHAAQGRRQAGRPSARTSSTTATPYTRPPRARRAGGEPPLHAGGRAAQTLEWYQGEGLDRREIDFSAETPCCGRSAPDVGAGGGPGLAARLPPRRGRAVRAADPHPGRARGHPPRLRHRERGGAASSARSRRAYAWKLPPVLYGKARRLQWLQAMGAGVDWVLVPELPGPGRRHAGARHLRPVDEPSTCSAGARGSPSGWSLPRGPARAALARGRAARAGCAARR